jgi:hypothetical protein
MPQYGIFVISPEPADPMSLTPDHLELLNAYPAQVTELGGTIVTGFAFQPSTNAKAVRGGSTHDGVLLRADDLVAAGFYVLDAPDLQTAVRIAALNPATRAGGVEVRPLFVPPSE